MAETTTAAAILQKALLTAISKPPPPQPPDTSTPAAANPAIALCLQAYTNVLQESLRNEDRSHRAEQAAKTAYRSAMPPLTGSRNIRDFVACIAHGMAIDAIDGRDGAKLLYAAQVANAAQNTQRRIKAKSSAITAPQPQEIPQLPNTESDVTKAQ